MAEQIEALTQELNKALVRIQQMEAAMLKQQEEMAASVAAAAAHPLVEPTLSSWQAARHGGTCRQNINLAVQHLEGRRGDLADRSDRDGSANSDLASALLGRWLDKRS